MYKIHIQQEKATSLPFTKIYIGNEKVGRTNMSSNNSVDSSIYDQEIYLKGLFLKTNSVKCPSRDYVYSLTWKQNYIYVILFMMLILYLVFKAIGTNDYTVGIRITIAIFVGPVINFMWNDLLLLGRKINIKEIGE